MKKANVILSVLSLAMFSTLAADEQPLPIIKPHRISFGLLQFEYDYVQPNDFYAGLGIKMSNIWNVKDSKYKRNNYLTNIESKLGYNFGLNERFNIIPYLGIGFTHFNIEDQVQYLKDWAYLALGGRMMYRIGPVFSLGLNLKGYRSLAQIEAVGKLDLIQDKSRWTYEAGIPLVWSFGDDHAWEFQFEPSYMRLPNFDKTHFLGSKILFAYRF